MNFEMHELFHIIYFIIIPFSFEAIFFKVPFLILDSLFFLSFDNSVTKVQHFLSCTKNILI